MNNKVTIETAGHKIETTTDDMRRLADSLNPTPAILGGNAQSKLRSLVERIERLNEDKAAVTSDLKEVYAEAKGDGFDVKILRKVVRLRAQDRAKLDEEQALIDLYISAIGGL